MHSRGKTTYGEVFEMGNRLFHTLYSNLRKRLSTEEGQKQEAAEEMQYQVEEEVGL